MRLYLAGPMTGHPDLNFPAFHAAAASLRALGHDIVSPAEINGGADELVACAAMSPEQQKAHWKACMRKDIAHLVTCEGVVLLPGWLGSRGARQEHSIAIGIEMPTYSLIEALALGVAA